MAEQFPNARLYGTSRHKQRAAALRWERMHVDNPALHAQLADDLLCAAKMRRRRG